MMDVLTDVLHTLELRGWLSSRRELSSPWRYEFLPSADSTFHAISGGGAFLSIEGEAAPIELADGDVVLFPNGHRHMLADHPESALTREVQLDYSPQREHRVVYSDGAGPKLLMLCGAFQLTYPGHFPLLQRLPKLIHIRGAQGEIDEGCADLLRMIARESASAQLGSGIMLRRLTELLFIQVIRLWVEQQADTVHTWALRDQPISAALGLIHQNPAHKWTVQELAQAAGLSRSAFAARFTDLVGEPPLTYLTRWRMLRASRLLKSEASMESIATTLGYESEAAFRKAFKREIGIPPAQYRRGG